MDVPDSALLLLVLALAAATFAAFWQWGRARAARVESRDLRSKRTSDATRYGFLTEEFAPWMARWPGDAQRFRHLGDPVDGVQFEQDAIYLVEVKSGAAKLSRDQKRYRELVTQGRVGWVTFYVDGDRAPEVIRPWEGPGRAR